MTIYITVFEILLRFTESKNWRDAFYSVIPKRKILDERNEIDVKVSEDAWVEPAAEPTTEEHVSDDGDNNDDDDNNNDDDNDDQHLEESESWSIVAMKLQNKIVFYC